MQNIFIKGIVFFTSGFSSIPYDILKWGGGRLWGELKKRQCLTDIGQSLYNLIEKTVKEKTWKPSVAGCYSPGL